MAEVFRDRLKFESPHLSTPDNVSVARWGISSSFRQIAFWWRDAVNSTTYINVILGGDCPNETFETTEVVGNFRLFRLPMLVYHPGLDVVYDLVGISNFRSILVSFDENTVVISWHAHIVNEIDIERHDDSNKVTVMDNKGSVI